MNSRIRGAQILEKWQNHRGIIEGIFLNKSKVLIINKANFT